MIRLELLRVSHADNATTSLVYTDTHDMSELDIIWTIFATKLIIFGLNKISDILFSDIQYYDTEYTVLLGFASQYVLKLIFKTSQN